MNLNNKCNELKSTCPLQMKKYVTIKDTHLNHAILTIKPSVPDKVLYSLDLKANYEQINCNN